MLDKLTSDEFQPCLDQSFETHLGAVPVTLTLTEVSVQDARYSRPGARLAFSLIFQGPAEPLLPQATYTMTNKTLGELTLFTVPLGPADGRLCYEVVFN